MDPSKAGVRTESTDPAKRCTPLFLGRDETSLGQPKPAKRLRGNAGRLLTLACRVEDLEQAGVAVNVGMFPVRILCIDVILSANQAE